MPSDWDDLSSDYRKRLISNGITRAQWEQRQSANSTPLSSGRSDVVKAAEAHNIGSFFPGWDDMEKADKKTVAKLYEHALFGPGQGAPLTREELAHRPDGVHTTHHRSDQQIRELMDLQDWYLEMGGDEADFWKDFREAYGSAFSNAA